MMACAAFGMLRRCPRLRDDLQAERQSGLPSVTPEHLSFGVNLSAFEEEDVAHHPASTMEEEEPRSELTLLPGLDDDIVRHCIWSRIIDIGEGFTQWSRQMATIRSVCRTWRQWTEGTGEYRDYAESRVEYLLQYERTDELSSDSSVDD